MKRILLLLLLVPVCAFAQKKHASKAEALSPEAIDSTLTVIYNSYDADRQMLANQKSQTTDTIFLKALNFQLISLEQRCAERMWGFILMQPASEYTLQLMYRFRSSVDQQIVERSLETIKDKSLTQSDVFKALKYYVNNGYVKIGDNYRNIQLNAIGTLTAALNLSDEVKQKNIMLVLGDNENDAIPASFKKLYGKIDHDAIDVIQIRFFKDETDAAAKLAENKEEWRVFADVAGIYSNVIMDYNVMETPLCFMIEKGTGKIVYEGIGISDEMMGEMLTM